MVRVSRKFSPAQVLKMMNSKGNIYWAQALKKYPLELFKAAARTVPAYRDFLKKNRINPEKINTWDDFQMVPPTDKKNYLREYSLEKLSWRGTLKHKPIVFTSTSGSTGEPFYFPRQGELDWQYSLVIEQFLKNSSYGSKEPVLVIIGFGMGVWIGGIITYKAFEIASQRGNCPVSILTPGINKDEIFKALKGLSPCFKTTILAGYPPFIKDVIDESVNYGIDLKKINLRLLFAAESFNEKFRQYLIDRSGVKNPYLDTMNIYGSADIGAMAFETPISILIRSLAIDNKQLFEDIFGGINKTPTLAQFDPMFINFEAPNGEILLTGDNTVPLIRYAIGDHGGITTFKEISDKVEANGINLKKEVKKAGIKQDQISKLPFVYVYERTDFSTKLYGAIIYPEHIREAIQHPSVENHLTGKFTMITKHDERQNQFLEINLELKDGVGINESLKSKVKDLTVNALLEKNAEYRNNANMMPGRVEPRIILWEHEHPQYFRPGTKQKWVKSA